MCRPDDVFHEVQGVSLRFDLEYDDIRLQAAQRYLTVDILIVRLKVNKVR
jgi:hypothetical protein